MRIRLAVTRVSGSYSRDRHLPLTVARVRTRCMMDPPDEDREPGAAASVPETIATPQRGQDIDIDAGLGGQSPPGRPVSSAAADLDESTDRDRLAGPSRSDSFYSVVDGELCGLESCAKMRVAYRKWRTAAQELKDRLIASGRELEALKRDVAIVRTRDSALRQALADKEDLVMSLRAQLVQKDKKISKLEEDCDRLEASLSSQKNRAQREEDRSEKAARNAERLERELREEIARLKRSEDEAKRLAAHRERQADLAVQRAQQTARHAEEAFRRRAQDAEARARAATQELLNLQAEASEAAHAAAEAAARVDELINRIEDATADVESEWQRVYREAGDDRDGSLWEHAEAELLNRIERVFRDVGRIRGVEGATEQAQDRIDALEARLHAVQQELDESLAQCCVCLGERIKVSMDCLGTAGTCEHYTCRNCLRGYIDSRFKDPTLYPIRCPGGSRCPTLFEGELGENLAMLVGLRDKDLQIFMRNLTLTHIPPERRSDCPYPSCDMICEWDPTAGENVECFGCRKRYCAVCRAPWHQEITCEQYQALPEDERSPEDRAMTELARQKGWPRCPRCTAYVQLARGCRHMRCRCGQEFCYYADCRRTFLPEHSEECRASRGVQSAACQHHSHHFTPTHPMFVEAELMQ
eukprot:tig00000123_g6925.t1